MAEPRITKITLHEYQSSPLKNLGPDEEGFNLVYTPGNSIPRKGLILRIETDAGVVGEYAGGGAIEYAALGRFAPYLIGKNALERERINSDIKRAQRQAARIGIAPIDIALWDLAGKYFGAPIHKLLGGHKDRLPCYASTYHGDEQPDGLSTGEAYADFAQHCLEMGYPAFKIHGWPHNSPIRREIETVRAVGERVGDKMDLMLDPACEYETFAAAVKVGRACDEQDFMWYEDPFRDGGISQFAHRKLRQLIRTPLLQTEHVRSLEPHMDFLLADATDYMRGDVGYDGITGVMKLAHACEAVGVDIEFHGPGPAQRQCMAAIRNTNYYELGLVHPKAPSSSDSPLYKEYDDTLEAVDSEGCVPVPQGDGLGVEIDWDWVKKNETGVTVYD
ncbi:MAG: mandelate racemase [Candidatus Poribacteria bacterium]|nr:mandelate racemase [Candidatus Poribacteria bacterium]